MILLGILFTMLYVCIIIFLFTIGINMITDSLDSTDFFLGIIIILVDLIIVVAPSVAIFK